MDFVGHDEGHITESTRHQILQLSRNSKYSRQRQREAEMHSDIVRIHDENEKMRSELEALNRRLEEARAQAVGASGNITGLPITHLFGA